MDFDDFDDFDDRAPGGCPDPRDRAAPDHDQDHDVRARVLLATCQNTPTDADLAAEAAQEAQDLARYARLLVVALARHEGRYGSAAVPAALANDLTRRFVADGCSVRRAPARSATSVVLTLYHPGAGDDDQGNQGAKP